MRRAAAAVLAILAALAACSSADPARSASPAADDVRLLGRELESRHPNPFHAVSRERFHAAAEELAQRVDSLDPNVRLVELMRLTALLGEREGHAGVFPLDVAHPRGLHLYPLRLYAFSDGLFVVASPRQGLVGARLLAVNGVPVERIVSAVEPLVPRDNQWSRLARVPQWLVTAEVLAGLGLADGVGVARFTFDRGDALLEPVTARTYMATFRDLFAAQVVQGLPRRPAPRYLRRRAERRFSALLDRRRALYVAYNVTLGDTSGFAARVLQQGRRARVRRVIVDLRHNPGGDIGTFGPLLAALRRLGRTKPLVVLISRTTFSAAIVFAAALEDRPGVRFVGEPSGGSPNFYDEAEPVTLPALGVNVYVDARYFEAGGPADARVAFVPDVPVALSARDFFGGRDPVLAAALALR